MRRWQGQARNASSVSGKYQQHTPREEDLYTFMFTNPTCVTSTVSLTPSYRIEGHIYVKHSRHCLAGWGWGRNRGVRYYCRRGVRLQDGTDDEEENTHAHC